MAVQKDMFTGMGGTGYSDLIAQRVARFGAHALSIDNAAEVLEVSPSKVREWVEAGRIAAANMNDGMTVGTPNGGARPMRPIWRMTADALVAFARNAERGL